MSRRIDEYKKKHRKDWRQFNKDAKLMRRFEFLPVRRPVNPMPEIVAGKDKFDLFGLFGALMARRSRRNP